MRRAVVAVLLLGGLLAVGAVLLVVRAEDPSRVVAEPVASLAPDASTPEDFARAACVRLRLAVQGISADSSADTVRRELAAARVLAAEALRGDGRFAPLSGGIAALDEAVRRDDAADAATGVTVAQAACQRTTS